MAGKDAEAGLIAALAAGKTVRDAATETGLSERTIYRRLEEAAFRQQVSDARRELLGRAVGGLADAASEAVATLRRNLDCGKPATEVRAALGILEQAIKTTELLELEQRVQELEQRLTTQGGKRR